MILVVEQLCREGEPTEAVPQGVQGERKHLLSPQGVERQHLLSPRGVERPHLLSPRRVAYRVYRLTFAHCQQQLAQLYPRVLV